MIKEPANLQEALEELARRERVQREEKFATVQTLSEIGKALRTAQAKEAKRDVSKPFFFCEIGDGWQVKVQGAKVHFHAWGKAGKQIKDLAQSQGQTPQELFANMFPQVRELRKRLSKNDN